jgi:hypothetical protein
MLVRNGRDYSESALAMRLFSRVAGAQRPSSAYRALPVFTRIDELRAVV